MARVKIYKSPSFLASDAEKGALLWQGDDPSAAEMMWYLFVERHVGDEFLHFIDEETGNRRLHSDFICGAAPPKAR